jgi:hypothetical protein
MYLERRGLPICALIEVLSCGLGNDDALTAKPTISSDFQRMLANKKPFPGSRETACERPFIEFGSPTGKQKKSLNEG